MSCAQPHSVSVAESETNANQIDNCIVEDKKFTVRRERGEKEEEDSSTTSTKVTATSVKREEKKEEEEEEEEVKVKVTTLNQDSCTEIEEEEIVVKSFASLAGIEDANEDEIKTKIEFESEQKDNSNEASEKVIDDKRETFNSATSEGGEESCVSPVNELNATSNMIPAISEKSDAIDNEQKILSNQRGVNNKEREIALNKIDAKRELSEGARIEQDATTTTTQTLVGQQNETTKTSKKSVENLSDDYKEALASSESEQRRLKEQLSIISDSPPPSPITPLSSASLSLASSADLPEDNCVSSESGSNYVNEGDQEEGDEPAEEDEEGEEFEDEDLDGDGEGGGEDFCAEAASTSTLRKLKMNTFRDIMVCEENRKSMEAARRLFDELARNGPSSLNREKFHNESLESSSDYYNRDLSPTGSEDSAEQQHQEPYDLKIQRRSGSSISNSNSFRQTLVCSVSPIDDQCDDQVRSQYFESHPPYPIDGDEIKQCQTAFRENKRLIEEQQVTSEQEQTSCNESVNSNNSCYNSGRWIRFNKEFLEQASQSKCSRCNRRVYPVDKMELDFTRTKLNIHRNCFKCQICSTLLRLETYAALDAKLYCPTHIKCVTPSH